LDSLRLGDKLDQPMQLDEDRVKLARAAQAVSRSLDQTQMDIG
jgi:hypothetical protein